MAMPLAIAKQIGKGKPQKKIRKKGAKK